VSIVTAVGAKNIGATYDIHHAYVCAVVGALQSGGPVETPGMLDLAQKLRGKINAVQLVDAGGCSKAHGTSPGRPWSRDKIEVRPVLEELAAHAGCPHDWWTIDLCFEYGVWPKVERLKKMADRWNERYGSSRKTRRKRGACDRSRP
jgi:hypothetical protein